MLKKLSTILSATLVSVATSSASFSAEPIANAGTLTCTLAPSEKLQTGGQTEAAASCNFVAISGEDFKLTGRIVRLSSVSERTATIVVMWSVQAPSATIQPQALSGRYTGKFTNSAGNESGDTRIAGTLYGAEESGIELRPLHAAEPAGMSQAGLTILELEIASVKI